MCPGKMCPGKNDLKPVSWLRTNCKSLIPKGNGTKNNQERTKRTALMDRRKKRAVLSLSQPMTDYIERENGLKQQHERFRLKK